MGIHETETAAQAYWFGPFRLVPARQLLTRDDVPVPIGTRAFDILTLLVSRAGRLVGRDELIAHAWPSTYVHDNNLKVNVAALRRALAERPPDEIYIATVPGRGYRFVAPVRAGPAEAAPTPGPRAPGAGLPSLPHVIGREGEIETVAGMLAAARFVTVVGPGGVGKTTVAGAVARRLAGDAEAVRFIDLTVVSDPLLVPEVIAAAFERRTAHADPLIGVTAALRAQRTLLVLDNCEHVRSAAALAAERLFAGSDTVRILSTSRETLHVRDEQVFRLAPLEGPGADAPATAAEALAVPAVALFVARAGGKSGYALTDGDAPVVCEICRQLDGIPLAIELAATRMATFDPPGLLAALEASLHVLGLGPRTAPVRQQTLFATLDWSYGLLSDAEASILRAVSTFAGYFTLDGAVAVAASDGLPVGRVIAGLESLADKSLVMADYRRGALHYRLLQSTRTYAAERLEVDGERPRALRRHARYHLDLFERAEPGWPSCDPLEWIPVHAARVDDLRMALAWAFGRDGDAALGIRIVAASLPLWERLPSLSDCRTWVPRALEAMAAAGVDDPVLEMKLTATKAWVKVFAQLLAAETEREWERCLALALRTGTPEFQLRAHWGLAVHQIFTGRHHEALDQLARLEAVAARMEDREAMADGERMTAAAEFYIGRLASAGERLDRLAGRRPSFGKRSRLQPYLDRAVAIRSSRAPVLWISGFPDEAAQVAAEGVDGARAAGHMVSLCNVLALAALPVALWRGEVDAADGHLGLLRRSAARQGLPIWEPLCAFFEGALQTARGRPDGVAAMDSAAAALVQGRFVLRLPYYLAMLADALSARGDGDAAQAAADAALRRIDTLGERWCLPEVLRIRGAVALGRGDAAEAERLFGRSLAEAEGMGAPSWQLRTATELARLGLAEGRADGAADRLRALRRRFSEGAATADLRAADALLARIPAGFAAEAD